MTTSHSQSDRSQPRVFVFLRHGLSLESWAPSNPADPLNTGSPYGYAAAASVTEMGWSIDAHEGRVSGLLRRGIRRVLGFDLVHAWRNRKDISGADVVWTHTEWESLAALAVLRLLGQATPRVIAQSVWLWDEWPHMSALRRRFYLALLQGAAVEVTLSERNKQAARRIRASDKVYCIPFGAGVNDELADRVLGEVPPGSGGYVLAVGSDRHRDWATLHRAARNLPDVSFRVATLSSSYPSADAPPNVRPSAAQSLDELYRLYIGAAVVVLPLTENLHASGCTVALEAQSLGRPLVTTDVGGLGLYLGDQGVRLYAAGEAESLATTLLDALADATAEPTSGTQRDFLIQRGLTADDYAARLVLLTRWLLTGEPPPDEIERPGSVRGLLAPPPNGDLPGADSQR